MSCERPAGQSAKNYIAVLIALTLAVGAAFAEDREWEEANTVLRKASDLETFKGEKPRFHQKATFLFHHTDKGCLRTSSKTRS